MNYPTAIEYSIGVASDGSPCVQIKSQMIDEEGRDVGDAKFSWVTIPEIKQIVGFCLRCGNDELMKAVRRPVYKVLSGPEHPFANE